MGKTIPEAVDYFIQQHAGIPILVEQVVDELIEKARRDRGRLYVDDRRRRLVNRFCVTFGPRIINSLTGPEISAWIDAQPGKPRTRRNFHNTLITLFNFAQERGYVSDSQLTAAKKVKKPRASRPPCLIFAPQELENLIRGGLELKSPGLLPLLVQCFAGLRASEVCQTDPKKDRIRWSDILLDHPEPQIHVREEVSKTDQERYVSIPSCLASWLTILQPVDSSLPLYTPNYVWKDYRAISLQAKVPWKRNASRKSFNTYHSALSESLAATAKEAGNSPQMISRYYRKEIPQAQRTAVAWFALSTSSFSKIQIEAFVAHLAK